jgi:hypothetical protein
MFDYVFPENGLMAFHHGTLLAHTVSRWLDACVCAFASAQGAADRACAQSMREWLGEAKLKEFINFVLGYLATLDIPVKR